MYERSHDSDRAQVRGYLPVEPNSTGKHETDTASQEQLIVELNQHKQARGYLLLRGNILWQFTKDSKGAACIDRSRTVLCVLHRS